VVPELRRSGFDPAPGPRGAVAEPAGFWPDQAGYGPAVDIDMRDVRGAAETVARPTVNGRHRRSAPDQHRDDVARMGGGADWSGQGGGAAFWPPQWDAPPPELHPDHPSAPVPRIRGGETPPRRPGPGNLGGPAHPSAYYSRAQPYPPGRGYDTGPARSRRPETRADYGYVPAGDNRVSYACPPAQSGYSGPAYAPAQGYDGGRDGGPAPRVQPHSGHSAAGGYGRSQWQPQATGARGSARQLYAVPDSDAADTGDIGPAGQQLVQFGSQAAALAEPARPGYPHDSGSFALAEQLLSNADAQAATITQDAWSQASAIRDAAEREAAGIRQQAAEIRAAAQQEAAEMRAACLSMSEQLGRLAAYVTENFAVPGGTPATLRAGAPTAALVAAPAVDLPARPATPATEPERPATRPAGRPAGKPGKPAARPATETRGRQARAARKLAALLAVTVMVGLASGATELALHGGKFFIFRANGAGATETGPVENQGPGQPDAPGAQHGHPAPAGKHHAAAQHNK
jgi:hypothetical protein